MWEWRWEYRFKKTKLHRFLCEEVFSAHSARELKTRANVESNVLTEKFYSAWLRRQVLLSEFQSLNLGSISHSVILGMLLSCVPQSVTNKMELVRSASVVVLRIHKQ